MGYNKYIFSITKNESDLDASIIFDMLSASLLDAGFDSFQDYDDRLEAYIAEVFEVDTKAVLESFPIQDLSFEVQKEKMPDINWNEEWEKNYFSPQLFASSRVVVRAPFHQSFPDADIEILISPKMAFGTGNHQTTSLIIEYLLSAELKDKSVLDMGAGTGILGILAKKLGAKDIVSIDIDKWSYENILENASLNEVEISEVIHGDANSLIGKKPFDIILANITRNILLEDMHRYVEVMSTNSKLILSGFYENDIDILLKRGEELGLSFLSKANKDNWALLELIKR